MREVVPAYTADQVRAAERPLLEAGVPLMRRAASALAAIAREQVDGVSRVLVLAGSGDNGGDALYAAAELADDVPVDVLTVGSRVHEGAWEAAERAGARRVSIEDAVAEASGRVLVLDGILGIGVTADPALRGPARDAVLRLRPLLRHVIAVDLPSGLHPDSGGAGDAVLAASTTVTFGAVKAGLVTGRGPELAGEIVLVDIGLGPALAAQAPVGEASVSRIITAPGGPR
ncbi:MULTISPECIES: NAD(P)H-hydrate epimerase [Microbacterium]|uniref:NAD(P)H-hydrate epimerase n=1 Tax=Microbacterium TaxID=33882 RepID=UPI00146C8811|nr:MULTISPECIES: NAD(P)H-hydrate epimerase [Microbacterium]